MTRLEKAARAIYDHHPSFQDGCWVEGPDYLDLRSVVVDGGVNLVEIARAVLTAVREPDEALVDEGVTGMAGANCAGRPLWAKQVRASHTAMIDAILRDHP